MPYHAPLLRSLSALDLQYFKLEAGFIEVPLSLSSPTAKEENHQTFRSKPRGLMGDRTCKDFNCTKSSVSIESLCFTFSFPWRFKSRLTF